MDSCSGGSSSGLLQNSGSEGDLEQQVMEQRKRKRMISNRESARRSRMRKQKHLDELVSQVSILKKQNIEIINNITLTNAHYLNIEAENSVFRAQVAELSHRLESLNEIIHFIKATSFNIASHDLPYTSEVAVADWCFPVTNYLSQPIMACADMFQ